ncbi:MAG: hypothetical protein IJQ90_03285 [Alphaproteobacteria bacterium]|nr:hypothetical protein [Alphaproteobacteria bacterium]
MKKLLVGLMGMFAAGKSFANPACAVCTIAIGATLSISRKLGVCDNAVAIWVGAFLVLMGYWLIKWFDRKNWHFWGRDIILILLSFSMIAGLYIKHLTYNQCYWIIDAFLFWAMVGGAIYILSQKLYEFMKRRNNNHAHFPFEKVVLALVMLFIASFIVAKLAA